MNTAHERRIAAAIASLDEHTADLVGLLETLDPVTATRRPAEERWSPAENGWHVALTTSVFASIIRGEGPLPMVPGTSAFPDDRWTLDAPPAVAAPGFLVPPPDATVEGAVPLMLAAAAAMARELRALQPHQAEGHVVHLPWGVVSVYQLCDWGGGHTRRHLQQVRQSLTPA